MNRPSHRPWQTHCRVCGAQLEVAPPSRTRIRGLFNRRQRQANMVCPRCGAGRGSGRPVILKARHPPRNPFVRLLFQLRYRKQSTRLTGSLRTRNPFAGDDGHMDFARMLTVAPFPVYGLKGRPIGLRLKSRGGGGHGTPLVVDRVHFGYVAGDPKRPEKAVDITQGPRVDSGNGELSAIESLVYNNVSAEHGESYFHQGSFYRDWNEERLQNTPRQQTTIQICGMNVEVTFGSWDEPQRVILAHLTIVDHPLRVVSLNASWAELQEALTTLVLLREDHETLAGHQQDAAEMRRQLYEDHDK